MTSNPLPKTSDLVTATQLGKEFGRDNVTIAHWLEEAKLTPVVTLPYGRGFMRLYEPGPARDAIRAKLPKPVPVAAPLPAVTVPSVDLGVLEERVETLATEVATVKEQNRALFAYVRDHIGAPVAKLVAELGGVQA